MVYATSTKEELITITIVIVINSDFLHERINIYQEGQVAVSKVCPDTGEIIITGYTEWTSLLLENVPASLWCAKWEIEIFSCLPKKRMGRDICIEISPENALGCFGMDIIVEVFRNDCNIGKYRVFDIVPNKWISTGELYSYMIIWTQIDG